MGILGKVWGQLTNSRKQNTVRNTEGPILRPGLSKQQLREYLRHYNEQQRNNAETIMSRLYATINCKPRECGFCDDEENKPYDGYYRINEQGCPAYEYAASLRLCNAEQDFAAEKFGAARKELEKPSNGDLNNNPRLKEIFDNAYLDFQRRADLFHKVRIKGCGISMAELRELQELEDKYLPYSGNKELKLALNKLAETKKRTEAEKFKGMPKRTELKKEAKAPRRIEKGIPR